MGSVWTGADSLRMVLTGAASEGAAQTVGNLSLGGVPSGTDAKVFGVRVYNAIRGVTIDHVSGRNGTGIASLTATSADKLAWTPPGGSQGVPVTIANGETQVIEGGGSDEGALARVTRTSADDLTGAASVKLTECYGTAVGFEDLTDAQATSGLTEYHCLCLYNGSASDLTDVYAWMDADCSSRVWIGKQVVIAGGNILADTWPNGGSPSGISFVQGTAETTLSWGTIAAGDIGGLWVKRLVEASAGPSASVLNKLGYKYTLGATTYYGALAGRYRVVNDSAKIYSLYIGQDAAPDFTSADKTGAALPLVSDALAADHTYYCTTRYTNEYGAQSQNITTTAYVVDAGGDEATAAPTAPTEITLTPEASGVVNVAAMYDSEADASPADTWLIYLTSDGSDPDPAADTPITQSMAISGGIAVLDYDTAGYANGTTIKAIVRTRRLGSTDLVLESATVYQCEISHTSGTFATDLSAGKWTELLEKSVSGVSAWVTLTGYTAASSDSANVTIYTTTADAEGTTALAEYGCCYGILNNSYTTVWTHDASNYARLFGDDVLVFTVGGQDIAVITPENGFRVTGGIQTLAFTTAPAMSAGVEINAVTGSLEFGVGGAGAWTRALEITTSGDMRVAQTQQNPGYPIAGAPGDEWEWNAGASALDFSKDLATICVRLEQVTVGGIINGKLIAARIRGS